MADMVRQRTLFWGYPASMTYSGTNLRPKTGIMNLSPDEELSKIPSRAKSPLALFTATYMFKKRVTFMSLHNLRVPGSL